ncbi:MAG: hypothetical protein ISS95_00635 [Candidatus Aenigmarchaeota archaeon]|nr:hypothetical protein [Candidatus Aenigmarchaeota archaeon]
MPIIKSPVYTTLKKIGLGLVWEDKNDGIILQKGVYLAEHAGVGLGYGFKWGALGPFSNKLEDDFYRLFEMKDYGKEISEVDDLNRLYKKEDTSDKIEKLEKTIELHKKDAKWFEVAGSLGFMNSNWSETKEKEELVNLAKKYMPKFEEEYVREVMDEIHFLIF